MLLTPSGSVPHLLPPPSPPTVRNRVSLAGCPRRPDDEFGAGFVQGPGMSSVNGRIRGEGALPGPSTISFPPIPIPPGGCSMLPVPGHGQSSVEVATAGSQGGPQQWPKGLVPPARPL